MNNFEYATLYNKWIVFFFFNFNTTKLSSVTFGTSEPSLVAALLMTITNLGVKLLYNHLSR